MRWAVHVITILAFLSMVSTTRSYGETITIKVAEKDLSSSNSSDVKELAAIEAALRTKGIDIKIHVVELPSQGYSNALTVKLLSGDIPDLIYFQGGDTKMAEQNILEDLRPWIEKAPYLKAALWPQNTQRLANYPYLLYVYPPRVSQPVIRTDWLAKLNMGVPQSVDDYVKLFKAIHDGDLDGNGHTGDTFGVTSYSDGIRPATEELDSVFNQAFGITGTWMKDADGAWINARISTQEKTKIAFYARLVTEGLLDPEFISNTFSVKEEKFYTGRAGVVFASSTETIDAYLSRMKQAHPTESIDFTLLPPPRGIGGQGLAAVNNAKETRGWAVSSLSKHKDVVMALLDFLASKEGQAIDRLGIEGEQYVRDGNTIKFSLKMQNWYARFISAANWTPQVEWRSAAAQQFLLNTRRWYRGDNAFIWPPEFATDIDATENVYRSWIARFVTGVADLGKWDQFVSEFNAAGNLRMTDFAQKHFSR